MAQQEQVQTNPVILQMLLQKLAGNKQQEQSTELNAKEELSENSAEEQNEEIMGMLKELLK